MFRAPGLASGMVVSAGLLLAAGTSAAQEAVLVVGPEDPGTQHPADGQSLFDELFATPSGYHVPYPFERLLEALNARLAPAETRTALIPLGRSLQRYAADPDYFASPRIVVAADGDGTAAVDAPLLRDRIFLGYQPAAEAIEVISYNEAAGRFEFQEVTDYGDGLMPRVSSAAREICIPCHQGHGPIFPRPLWSETNGSPEIVARLTPPDGSHHGVPVRQSVDTLDALDRSTDRANGIAVANRLWDEGCGDGQSGADCRMALLRAAFRYRLAGARPEWRPAGIEPQAARLQERLSRLWPGGLATPNPDLPNRDPLAELAAGKDLGAVLEPQGPMDPRSPRPPLLQWRADHDAIATFTAIARHVGSMFATADVAWLDAQLVARGGRESTYRAPCRLQRVARGQDREELRADCSGDDLTFGGYVILSGSTMEGGRIERLAVGDTPEVRRLRIAEGRVTRGNEGETLRIVPREDATGLSARLLSSLRVSAIVLRASGPEASVEITVVDDLGGLDQAIDRLAGAEAVGPGPLRRRLILGSLGQALTM